MVSEENELILPLVEEENMCLPLSINVVSKYWNVNLPLFEAEEISKTYQNAIGNILIEGIELAERHGLTCKILDGKIETLKKILDAGIPPIVIFPGVAGTTQHASIISGYNPNEKTIFHYIPKSSEEGTFQGAIPEGVFEKKWSQDGNVMIIIAPTEITSSLHLDNESKEKSYRLCFESERQLLKKNSSEAIQSLKKAIELYPKNSTAFSLLGSIFNEKNSPECVQYYQKAINLNQNCFLAIKGLGNYYLKNQKFQDSEKFYSKALQIDSERLASLFKNRAFVREKLQKNHEAKDDLKEYLKHSPKAADRGIIEQAIREL